MSALYVVEGQRFKGCCQLCSWAINSPSEEGAQTFVVAHVILEHPEDYIRATGKEPDTDEAHRVLSEIVTVGWS